MGTTKVKAEAEEEKKEYKKKVEEKKPKPAEAAAKELRVIARVAGTDLDGEKPIWRAIMGIKGISYSLTKGVVSAAGLDYNRKLGLLNEQEIQKLEQVIKNPENFGIPSWSLNRRRDIESGKDKHLTGSDLDMQRKFDIKRYVDLKTYRGVRHMLGLPVRGQHTRSTFRGGRVVGVIRKSALPTTAAGQVAATTGGAGGKEKEKSVEKAAAQAAPTAPQPVKKEEKKEEK